MAEISKITLPNGDTYDIKDSVARENIDHGNARIFSGDCSTAAATQRKDVTIAECTELIAGDVFVITFTNAQTYNGAPTMKINSLGAKNIRRLTGTNAGRYEWNAGEVVVFKWTGTYFVIATGGFATTTYYGRTKLYTGANSGSTSLALTPASLHNMANRSICPYYSTSETYAVGDKVRYGDYIYECINEIPTAEAWTAAHWQVASTLQEQVTSINSKLEWKVLADGTTTANVSYDTTTTIQDISAFRELMFTLQRVSNGRTFASSILPMSQFVNGAIYAIGSYSMFAGKLNQQTAMIVNAVAIYVNDTQVEFAINAHDEAIKFRLHGR